MSRFSFRPFCLAAALLAMPLPIIAASDKAPPPAVSAELRTFEKTLHEMAPEAKKMVEDGFKPAGAVALIEKTCAVNTDGLPDDLVKAFESFCDQGRRLTEVFKGLPAEVPGTGQKEWLEVLEKSDPEAAKRFREFPAKMKELEGATELTSWRLETAAARHGLNVRNFLDPDSIGRKCLTPAPGKTTQKAFAAALRQLPAKRDAAIAARKDLGNTMALLVVVHQSEAELLFALPTGGLPDELAAAFAGYGRAVEKLAWAFEGYPADMPFEKAKLDPYIEKAKEKDKDFEKSLRTASAAIKRRDTNKAGKLAAFVSQAQKAGLDLGKFAPAKPAAGKPK